MKCDVINLENQKVGDIDLDEAVFGVPVRADILGRMVEWQLAKRRAGTHKAKGRAEVSGTGKKPFRQKGTGHARQGSLRGPHMRGGGVAFGPIPRDHEHKLNKKVRKLALRCALSAKQAEGHLVVVEEAKVAAAKTRDLAKRFVSLGWSSALVIDGAKLDDNFARAARNIIGIDVLPCQGANVHDILRRETLVLTRGAVDSLVERLK